MQEEDPSAYFWNIASEILENKHVTKGTIMGFPCLRINTEFFASTDHLTGDLIIKLPKERVDDLISSGQGEPFAPAGRVFREWVLIKERDDTIWRALTQEAVDFVKANS